MRAFSETGKIVAICLSVALLVFSLFAFAGCNYCAHDLAVETEKTASTCLEHGHGYTYRCKKCDRLFGYSLEKGLYETAAAEELPLGDHVPSDNFNVRVKDGATSVLDYEVTTTCALCDAEIAMPDEHTASIVAPNLKKEAGSLAQAYIGTYLYGAEGSTDKAAGKPYTQITFKAKTNENDSIKLDPAKYTKDLDYVNNHKGQGLIYGADYEWDYDHGWGAYQRFPLYVPFKANVERKVCYIIKNITNPDHYTDPIEIGWSIDGDKDYSKVTVAPGEIKTLTVTATKDFDVNLLDQFIKVRNPNSANGELGNGSARPMKIEVVGVFYTPGTVSALNFDSMPDKCEYAAGEKFDPAGMSIYAMYAVDDHEYLLGKTVDPSKCVFSCGDRPLTKNDTKITVSYGGAKASVSITVN